MIKIQYAENRYRPTLSEMCKRCFPGDSDLFVALYFDDVYRNDETLILLENGELAASLQMIPYRIKIGKTIRDASYIFGTMTRPAYRRRGYMRNLLQAAEEEMKKKEIAIAFLVPQDEWLVETYKKYGYQSAFPVSLPERWAIPPNVSAAEYVGKDRSNYLTINVYVDFNESNLEILYPVYSRLLSQKENAVMKNRRQFSVMLRDFFNENGVLFANKKGIAFAFPGKNPICIQDFFFVDESIRRHFLLFIARYFSTTELALLNASTTSRSHFSGMINVLYATIRLPGNIYMSFMLD